MVTNGTNNTRRLLQEDPGKGNAFSKNLKKWGTAIFFSIWSFVLGIMVGRETLSFQMVRHDLKKELVRLKGEEVRKTEETIRKELTLEHAQTELAYPDMLKDRKTDLSSEQKNAPPQPFTTASEKQTKEVGKEVGKDTAKEAGKETGKDVRKKAESSKTSIVLKPLPKEEKTEPTSPPPGKRLTIQIASYKDSAEADKMIAKLKGKGYAAYKATADVGGKAWHRVRIGYFKDRADAEPTQQRLKKDSFSPIVINAD